MQVICKCCLQKINQLHFEISFDSITFVGDSLPLPRNHKMKNLAAIRQALSTLESKMLLAAKVHMAQLPDLHPTQLQSARNLIHYLVLRSEEIRELQDWLHDAGLSSLASSESHIHRQVQAIMERLGQDYPAEAKAHCDFQCGQSFKLHKKQLLFGENLAKDEPALMVTFETAFAHDYNKVERLLQSGMTVARLNCAHDDEATWLKMIHQIRQASRNTGLPCKIYMDLAGPKIRTEILGKGRDKGEVKVKEGQLIWLAYDLNGFQNKDVVISPHEPGIIGKLKAGERVYIDDGVIKAAVEKVKEHAVGIRILRISSPKRRIKNQKGINFPDSLLALSPLTEHDEACLPFICNHADMVGYSFISCANDLKSLEAKMQRISPNPPSVVLKIETPEAVRNLPQMLLEGMKREAFGVMIARGDLAVELGFERMGEIQDEILWICESAHVPVIWATQVLDHMNKTGLATRSEITDAIQAVQSECVMVNKGPHILKVLETLKKISSKARAHRIKKRFTFRPLRIAQQFLSSEAAKA